MARLPMRRGAIERSDPMSVLDDFAGYMNRMMGPYFPAGDMGDQTWTPLVDMSENDKEYHIDIEAPGVMREDLSIDIEGQELSVSGKYRSEDHHEGNDVRRSSRRSGQFEYTVRLPHTVDAGKSSAELKDGVLCISVPKKESAGQKKIAIK
ncbi:Hsp20/alpha crystallin family protein [Glycomyces luteolus]|uniref:Hsp20/alpha crystallin family protein n=1 Tax=Glycomyces luteolus TaxID=2670330 RepID=A0A9X3SPW0_9ACTN|nr:Hsp20/alpha crystallin family protein [Glycomyces luteolus]MDA1359426.1 Hsp20/alpha crystallin family protein [Glycomyces luteolus]